MVISSDILEAGRRGWRATMVAVVFVFGVAAPLASSALEDASAMGHDEDCCHGSSHPSEHADGAESKAAQGKPSGSEDCCKDSCAAGLSAACHCVSQQQIPLQNHHELRVVSGSVAFVPVETEGFHPTDIQPRAPGRIETRFHQTLLSGHLPTYLRYSVLRL